MSVLVLFFKVVGKVGELIPYRPWRRKVKKFYQVVEQWELSKIPVHKDWVVFWDGVTLNGFGDNIKPLYEELKKRHPDWKYIFIVNTPELIKTFPIQETVVLANTSEARRYLFLSKYYLTNMFGLDIKRKKEQVWVDTGHGAPIKSVGFMNKLEANKTDEQRDPIIKAETDFNYKTVNSFYTKDITLKSFVYKNGTTTMTPEQFFVTGYPRNDILFHYSHKQVQAIKEKLHIANDKKVILYTPTYRSTQEKFVAELSLDAKTLSEKLGEKYIFLIRSHYYSKTFIDLNENPVSLTYPNIINVSHYPEISELYLISDILITDYSSTAVDFSCLKRPMIFYIYDYEKYNTERGFPFDFKNEIPGPCVYNTPELIEAIFNIEQNQDLYAEKFQAFYNKHCADETGHAAEKIIDLILKGRNITK